MSAAAAAPRIWRDAELDERFARLTDLLKVGERFWHHHAFQYLQLPWESDTPALSQALRELSLERAEMLVRDDERRSEFLSGWLPLLAALDETCAIGAFAGPPLPDIEPRDMPGRKWQQIRHFAPRVPRNDFAVLEWCAGKAHLGRALALQRGCEVSALEYDARLVVEGAALAAREKIAIDFQCVDVMSERAGELLRAGQNAVALHACGDLHTRLLTLCAQRLTATITLAPCCYQLMRDESRYVLSQAARASGLSLRRDDLRTAVHGTVTAPQRQSRQRQQLQAWRLGFDLLQRDLRECSDYQPTPSLPATVLADGFAVFCDRVAQHKRVKLPDAVDYSRYERAGWDRLREVVALDLPRIAFRRALELWLALDRALFLRERGYAVEMGVFCAQTLTPRNILIRAQHR